MDSVVRRVVGAMWDAPGDSVSVHAAAVGLSERQLRRRFSVAVGLGPKAYMRVIRLHQAVALARRSVSPQWADIALRCGFYDQPHMNAEFRRAVGASCGCFLQASAALA